MEQAPQDPDRRCQHCGTALSEETTGGLCPRCLLEMNFASRTMPGGETSPQIPPPTPEEMADKFPQFEIVECLGRGGMGVVYKAWQKSLDRWVAIKVLAPERINEERFAAHFGREAKTLAKMSHPNIVTVFDHGESDGLFYIVMEYVDGVNLRDLLREGKIEPEQALAIVPPICEALEYAHDKGVVHRDIKPENLLLDRDGRVKIADFGIASLVGASGEKSGTPPYMAPEQETGVVDRRADIYALGAVLYEMLTGERPDKDLVAPSKRVELDVRLDEIVLRALEKEPARRYQTAGEFRTVVQTMAASEGKAPATTAQVQPKGLWAALKAGKPEAEWEGRAPGWRIRCRSCGFIEHFGKYGIRMAAAGTPWTLGRCQRCRRIRIHVIEKGPVPVGQALPAPTTNPAPTGANSQAAHSPRRGIVMVGRRGGKAVINWAGVALVFLMILPIALAGGALFDLALHRPVAAMGMVTSVCVALLVTGGALGRARSTPLERLVDLDEPPGSQAQTARLSRTAILGAVFAYIFFLTVYLKFFREGGAGLSGLSQFFGAWTMILGYVALEQIRRSAGSLHGRGLALFDVLLFPLLVLNAGVYLGAGNLWRANPPEVSHPVGAFLAQNEFLVPLFALALCAVLDLLIVRRAWRAANKPVDDEAPGSAAPAASFSWQSHIMFSVIVGVTVAAGIVLMRQLPKVGSWAEEEQAKNSPEQVDDRSPQQVARDFMTASYASEIERALSMIGGPLGQTPKELARMIHTYQASGEEAAGPVDLGEWHEEGAYAVTSYLPPGGRSPVECLLILERVRGTWMVVGTGIHRPDASLEDELRAFKRFRSVNREDRHEVTAAFGRAVKTGDFALAAMLVWRPMPVDPHHLAREFSNANRGLPGADPTAPLSWYQEGPYAVTRVAFAADQPELVSYLILRQTEGIWRVVWSDSIDPEATLAEALLRFKQEQMVAYVMVEDLALRFVVAIREKDEETLRELCVDRTEGWTEAMVGHFAMELRERFRQQTGEEFTMYPDPSAVRVDGDLAVVVCRAFRDVQKKLGGNILVLHFCRTEAGWKVWTIRNAPESQPIEEHLEKARKWAAEWDHAETGDGGKLSPNTPELAAHFFMSALRNGEVDGALAWMAPEMKAHAQIHKILEGLSKELKKAYAGNLRRLTTFTEWYPKNPDEDTRFIGARLAGLPADDGAGREHGLYLILSPTPEGWGVAHLDDAYSDKPLSYYVDRIVRILPGEGPLFREQATERPVDAGGAPSKALDAKQEFQPELPPNVRETDPVERAKALPVNPPAAMPEGSPLTVQQVKQILEKVTWGEFIATFADDGHEQEVSWKKVQTKGGNGLRFEVSFRFGGEKMLLDFEVDPEFQRAVPSRLHPARNPEQVMADASEFLPLMMIRYAAQSGHPAAAPAMEEVMARARQARDRSTMRQYGVAIVACQVETGSLPDNLQALVERKILRELMTMENHETGKMEPPLYHAGPDLRIEAVDVSKTMVLAAPSADPAGKRIVGFLDSHVAVIDEADYQEQLKAQQKPPMEKVIDAFLETCARKGITDNKQLFDELGMADFIEEYGNGERAMREHHDKLPPVMRRAIDATTGEPSVPFFDYLKTAHLEANSAHKPQALLLLRMLGGR